MKTLLGGDLATEVGKCRRANPNMASAPS
jgi:hypothetical protein